MREAILWALGWLNRHAVALLLGLLLGLVNGWHLCRRRFRCYYEDWMKAFKSGAGAPRSGR